MNMFKHEIKTNIRSTITWIIVLIVVGCIFLTVFPAYAENKKAVEDVFQKMPKELLSAMGMDIDRMFSITGFYAYIFFYVSLCGAIQAMNLGLSIFSKETREHVTDFLLTKPTTRIKIINSKLFASLSFIIVTNIIYLPSSLVAASILDEGNYDKKAFALISLSLLILQLIYLSLGMIIGVSVNKIKSIIPTSLGIVFATFGIRMIAAAINDEKLSYLSPFSYFDYAYIQTNLKYDGKFMVISIAIICICIIGSYIVYKLKDIHA